MGWTKKQLILKAFSKIGYASYIYDLTPERLLDGLTTMDAMLASWAGEGIRIGYNLASSPDTSNLDDDSGLIDAANEAVYLNTAKSLAGDLGKSLSPTDAIRAKESYDALLNKAISRNMVEMQPPCTLPLGAGNKPWRNNGRNFVRPPTDDVALGPDDNLVLE